MKSTNVKSLIAKVMTVGLLAGAVVLAAPSKAEAQGVPFGVQIGYPHYDYSRRDSFEFQRREAIRRHEEQIRREEIRREEIRRAEWQRAHRFHDRFGWR